MTRGLDTTNTPTDGSQYTYDAQTRLVSATRNGVAEAFKYDGLGRQVSRQIGTAPPTYNVYDGWNLIAEYAPGASTPTATYIYGPTGLTKAIMPAEPVPNRYYYQDASGSTSHVADSGGQLKEWYRYDLQGTPAYYDSNNQQKNSSDYAIRHLFTGQQWYSELGLYNLRNRFYSPDIGRFLQPDPIGFLGDFGNLYRYCGNNPVNFADPIGLFRWGQFAIGASSLIGGTAMIVGGAGASATGAGAIAGVPLMLSGVVAFGYGIGNIVASFSDVTGAAEFQDTPSNLSGAVARAAWGEGAQHSAEILENILHLSGREGIEALHSGIEVGLSWYGAISWYGRTYSYEKGGAYFEADPSSPTGWTLVYSEQHVEAVEIVGSVGGEPIAASPSLGRATNAYIGASASGFANSLGGMWGIGGSMWSMGGAEGFMTYFPGMIGGINFTLNGGGCGGNLAAAINRFP